MSHLDLSISFSHLLGLLFCFYIFLHYFVLVIVKYFYNNKLRYLSENKLLEELDYIDNSYVLKKLLKL